MTFTDEMLKQLKGPIEDNDRWSVGKEDMEALLARLEAAEAVVRNLDLTPEGRIIQDGHEELIEAWRKSCGKEPQ